ncbi:MAG TPA: hypothetical protein VFS59_04045 [Gemmatimonadaceae bacterium]|nr:hypothetical protein [Gemmatimonadaceae bacterium]
MTLLSRASTAVRRAHAEDDGGDDSASESGEALLTTLENQALREAERAARGELEEVVRRFAERLRAEGAPPEIGVRRVKCAVEPVVFASRDHDGADVEWRRGVVGDVVTWFVHAYYGT